MDWYFVRHAIGWLQALGLLCVGVCIYWLVVRPGLFPDIGPKSETAWIFLGLWAFGLLYSAIFLILDGEIVWYVSPLLVTLYVTGMKLAVGMIPFSLPSHLPNAVAWFVWLAFVPTPWLSALEFVIPPWRNRPNGWIH